MSDEVAFAGVRLARPEDDEPIYRLLLKLYDENALLPMNEKKVRATIRSGTHGEGGIVGIIEGRDGIEASIGMAFAQFWYTEAWHLNELWCFVRPDRRNSTHARRLIEFGKWCADRLSSGDGSASDQGLGSSQRVPLLLGIVTRHRLFPKMRLFQRQAPQVGAIFMHGIDVPDTFSQRRAGEMPAKRSAGKTTAGK